MEMSCIDIGMMNVSMRWRLAGSDLADTWTVASLHWSWLHKGHARAFRANQTTLLSG